jgi:tetrahydromethanopterin S-methyltransferase subunit B
MERKRYKDDRGWRATYLHFELLKKHIDKIDELIQKFDYIVEQKRKEIDVESTKRGLTDLEKSIPHYFPEVGKIVRIAEKKKLEESIEKIKEIRQSKFDDEEILEKGKLISGKKEEIKNKGLAETFKGCPVFDVKAVILYYEYEDLKTFIASCNLDAINQDLMIYDTLRKKLEEHRLFKLEFDQDTRISSAIFEWIKKNISSEKGKTKQEATGVKEEITLKINEIQNLITRYKKAREEQIKDLDYYAEKLNELQTRESTFNQTYLGVVTTLSKIQSFFEGEVVNSIDVSFNNLQAIKEEYEKKKAELDIKIKQKFEKSNFTEIIENYKMFFDEKTRTISDILAAVMGEFEEKITHLYGRLDMICRLLSSIQKTLRGT